jgi:DNA-directed RNA polymerase sigma subunit (sigma70/sigma32)
VADKESSPPGSGIPVKDIERALKSLGERKRREIERALKSLSGRERGVLEHRYGLKGEGPWSCEEVGRHFHVTTARIQQIDNMAHRKLWEACASDEDLIDLIAQWNSVFPEKKGWRWFFGCSRKTKVSKRCSSI